MTIIVTIADASIDPITTIGMAIAITTEAGTIIITTTIIRIATIMGIATTIIIAHCSRSSFAKIESY